MSCNFFSLPNQCNLIFRAYRLTSPFLAIILYYIYIYIYISTRYRNVSNNFSNNLILANKERALAVRSNVFDQLTSKVCDAKQIVHELQETLEWNQASLEQPNHEAKKWIRSLTREARRSKRLDVVEHLREITPAGTTGEWVFCSLVFFVFYFFYYFFFFTFLL